MFSTWVHEKWYDALVQLQTCRKGCGRTFDKFVKTMEGKTGAGDGISTVGPKFATAIFQCPCGETYAVNVQLTEVAEIVRLFKDLSFPMWASVYGPNGRDYDSVYFLGVLKGISDVVKVLDDLGYQGDPLDMYFTVFTQPTWTARILGSDRQIDENGKVRVLENRGTVVPFTMGKSQHVS